MLTSDAYSGWHALTVPFLVTARWRTSGLEVAFLAVGRPDENYPTGLGVHDPGPWERELADLLKIPVTAVDFRAMPMMLDATVRWRRGDREWKVTVTFTTEQVRRDPGYVKWRWADEFVKGRRQSIEEAHGVRVDHRAHYEALAEQRLERCVHNVYWEDDGFRRYLPCNEPSCSWVEVAP